MTGDLDLCRMFADAHPGDAALALERLPATDVASLFDVIPSDTAARVLDRMAPTAAADCLARMRGEPAAALLAELHTDLAVALLRRVDDANRTNLLEMLPEEEAGRLRAVLRHPEGTAGALMDPRAMSVADDLTVGEALARVSRSPRHMLYYVYVVDRARRLVGVVDVRELMLARSGEPLASVMRRPVIGLAASMGRAAILAHAGWKLFHALPVVDEHSTLLGAIRYQTLRRLEDDTRDHPRGSDAAATAFALGELYWLGLSGLLDGMFAAAKRWPSHEGGLPETDRGRV